MRVVPASTATLMPRTLAPAAPLKPVRPVSLAPPRSKDVTPLSLYCLVSGSKASGAGGRDVRAIRCAGAGVWPASFGVAGLGPLVVVAVFDAGVSLAGCAAGWVVGAAGGACVTGTITGLS